MARVFLVSMLGMHAFFLWSVRSRIARGDPDFTAFYTAGKMLRSGRGAELYNPAAQQAVQREFSADSDIRRGPLRYIHPPFEALLFLPFAFFSYRDAFVLWDLLNLGLVVAVSLLLRRTLLAAFDIRTWEIVLALLAFFPVFSNLFQGQDAIVLLLLVVLAFRALDLRADFMAGLWLGAGLFRYHLVIPLILIFALWGRRKIVLGFAVASAAALLVSLAIVGWQATLQYPSYLWLWVSVPGFGRTPPSLFPNLLGLVTGWSKLDNIQWMLRLAVLALSIGVVIIVARMKRAANDPRFFNLSLACAVAAALLVGYNTSTYDLCLLVLPLVLVARYCFRELPHRREALVALVSPALPLLVSPLWFLVGMYWQKFNLMAILLVWWLYAMRNEMLRVRAAAGQPQTIAPVA
jgi:hypothetical protein